MELGQIIYSVVTGVFAFLLWLFRNGTRRYVDKKAENLATIQDTNKIQTEIETVKSKFSEIIHVRTNLFDTELEIMREVWGAAWDFQAYARSLRPIVDSVPEDENERKKIYQERYNLFIEKTKEFREVVIKNKPFIPPKVYGAAFALRNDVVRLQSDFELTAGQPHRFQPDWKMITEVSDRLDTMLDELSDGIRNHLYGKGESVD